MADLARRLAAEAMGTGLLVAAVVGSGIMASGLSADGGVALLANTVATAAILVVLVAVLGPLSGAHLNPAVSLVMAWRGLLGWRELGPYVAAQVAGGVLGAWLAHGMFGLPLWQAGATVRAGGPQLLSEGVATFALVAAILGGLRHDPRALPWLVGLTVAAGYWFTASTSFANPAVTLARGFSDSFAGIRPGDVPGFVAAQVAGALLAGGAMGWLLGAPSGPSTARGAPPPAPGR